MDFCQDADPGGFPLFASPGDGELDGAKLFFRLPRTRAFLGRIRKRYEYSSLIQPDITRAKRTLPPLRAHVSPFLYFFLFVSDYTVFL